MHINKLFINFKISPSIQRIYIKFHNIYSFLGLAAAETLTLTLKDFASDHLRVITRLEEENKKTKKKGVDKAKPGVAEQVGSSSGEAAEADCNRSSSASISSTENAFVRPDIFSFSSSFSFSYTATQEDEFETYKFAGQCMFVFIDLFTFKKESGFPIK